jgi:hypothetical protein
MERSEDFFGDFAKPQLYGGRNWRNCVADLRWVGFSSPLLMGSTALSLTTKLSLELIQILDLNKL